MYASIYRDIVLEGGDTSFFAAQRIFFSALCCSRVAGKRGVLLRGRDEAFSDLRLTAVLLRVPCV